MKNKGFTLIELLAVILILGIIALIAIPTVNKIINESKKSAFESTSNNIVKAIEDNCQKQLLKGEEINTTYTFTDSKVTPSLDLKGKLPTSGTITVDNNCKTIVLITNGAFSARKIVNSDDIIFSDGDEVNEPTYKTSYLNGDIVYYNPTSGKKCSVTDYNNNSTASNNGNKVGCMKWYAFNDTGSTQSRINLLLDHNTTVASSWGYSNVNGPTEALTKLKNDTKDWSDILVVPSEYNIKQLVDLSPTTYYQLDYTGYKARLISAEEVAGIVGYTTWKQSSYSAPTFYFDSKLTTESPTCKSGNTSGCQYGWLYDRTSISCKTYGCLNNASSSMGGIGGYWTSSGFTDNYTFTFDWYVHNQGLLSNVTGYNSSVVGIRPVISVLKFTL